MEAPEPRTINIMDALKKSLKSPGAKSKVSKADHGRDRWSRLEAWVREGSPVSLPIRREDLDALPGPQGPRIDVVLRAKKSTDPWRGFFSTKQSRTQKILAKAGTWWQGHRHPPKAVRC